MEYQLKCQTCGADFTAKTNRSRFCSLCARQRQLEQMREHRKKRQDKQLKGESTEKEIELCDTPENVAACLSCAKERCDLDTRKWCEVLNGPKPQRKNPVFKERELKCKICGAGFMSKAARSKFCPSCAKEGCAKRQKLEGK